MALVGLPLEGGVVRTVRMSDPPKSSELQRRQEAGCLPYPSRLAYRLIVTPTSETKNAYVFDERPQRTKGAGRVNEHDRYRQARYGKVLRSHHVPVAPFVTFANQQEQKQGNMGISQKLSTAEEPLAYQRRLQGNVRDEDYVMCGGFHPLPGQYYYKPGQGITVMPQPIVQLQRMYLRDVVPPPARLVAVPEGKSTMASI
ncbi:hypothetical protein LSM04_003731 [Trypanosoma melophagium]|uniref:uncharacterized protein n=1 Tax=Trypanosoma melophagium TaxID=715481 RepID=UPI00351A703F|nr:hypothetical protein LSM04_003731 [Trypanosoma melophagium]